MMKYMPVVLFLSLLILSNQALAIRTDPYGFSADVGTATACILSGIIRIFLASLPPGITLLLIYKFIQVERKKDTGEVYTDEIVSILFMGMLISVVFYMLFATYEYFGIPVRELYNLIFYCDINGNTSCNSITQTGDISVCSSAPFGSVYQFALSILVAFTRIFFFLAPIFTTMMIIYKSMQKQINLIKRGEKDPIMAGGSVLFDGVVAIISILAYFDIFLKFFYVDYKKFMEIYLRATGIIGG